MKKTVWTLTWMVAVLGVLPLAAAGDPDRNREGQGRDRRSFYSGERQARPGVVDRGSLGGSYRQDRNRNNRESRNRSFRPDRRSFDRGSQNRDYRSDRRFNDRRSGNYGFRNDRRFDRRRVPYYRNRLPPFRGIGMLSQAAIQLEIRSNERQILRLELELRRTLGGGYQDGYGEYDDSPDRVSQLEWEIRQLVERNQYLRSMLYRRW